MKFKKAVLIEVVEVLENGDVLVQSDGDASDQWVIDRETFESSYVPVEE